MLTALVLVIVLATKFTHGAYLVVIAMPLLYAMMSAIRRHYDQVSAELEPEPRGEVLPARIHAVVLGVPAAPAHSAGPRLRPGQPTGHADRVTVSTSTEEARALQARWAERGIPVPLTVLDSPYRDITGPVLDYVGRRCAGTARGTWSPSTSPSTSSGTGGSTCCTTRARCGSRPGCCSSGRSW